VNPVGKSAVRHHGRAVTKPGNRSGLSRQWFSLNSISPARLNLIG
jgi:hypothetical protein